MECACAALAKAGGPHHAVSPSLFAKSGYACRGSGRLLNCKNGVVYPSVLEHAQLITYPLHVSCLVLRSKTSQRWLKERFADFQVTMAQRMVLACVPVASCWTSGDGAYSDVTFLYAGWSVRAGSRGRRQASGRPCDFRYGPNMRGMRLADRSRPNALDVAGSVLPPGGAA